MKIFLIILIIFYFFYLYLENFNLKKQRKTFKYIIHVNGIRGKSTVSRLIDAGLRANGYKIFTKTTGTSPRIINVEGIEKEINRQGKANIKEQIKAINWAYKDKAEILILECMAVKPELQFFCENKILKSDIVAITNVREDHLDEMGTNLNQIAESLSNTIPTNGAFFTADESFFDFFKIKCKLKQTEAFLSNSFKKEFQEIDFADNVSLALDICKYIGVDEKMALNGMKNYNKDPGRLKVLYLTNENKKSIYFVNILAANDPNSTEIILQEISNKIYWNNKKLLLVNNRIDRLSRMEQYIEFVIKFENSFDEILIFGECKELFYKHLLKNNISHNKIKILKNSDFVQNIRDNSVILAVGNICREGKKLVTYFEEKGEVIND